MNRFNIILILLTSTFIILNASTSHYNNSELIKLVQQQQYLAKKVSKQYIDLQSDLTNIEKKEMMKRSIQIFHQNHMKLINHRSNTKLINQKLTKVDQIWKIAYKLSETEKHNTMLMTAMDDISYKMQELQKLYSKVSK
jgi:predicted patatin/cPLA2 family phospholipase